MSMIRELLNAKGHKVFSVGPNAPVREALKEMIAQDVGALVVIDDGRPVGIVSERDYVRKVVGQDRSAEETSVADIMSPRVLFIRPEQSVDEGLALMYDKGIRHLPVMEGDSLIGVVSIKDLAGSCIGKRDFIIDQLENYIVGGR